MPSLPYALSQYWLSFSLEQSDPAYFQVTSSGQVLNWGGSIERYGQSSLERGQMIGDIFPFLAYSFPLSNVKESMQWIETESGLILDIHFYFEDSDGWILFIESGDEARKVQSLMQQGNELRLLRQNYDNIVQRQLTPEKISSVLESLLNLNPDSSGRVSIMQIRLNLREAYDLEGGSQEALELLNHQLKDVFKIAIEEGGWIHHVFGQTVAILFGLFPSSLDSAQQAIQSAHQLGEAFHKNLKRSPTPQKMTLGVGITTGDMGFDVRPVKNRKIFHMIGQTILRAEDMFNRISPGLLLVDQNTFRIAESFQPQFSLWSPKDVIKTCETNLYAQSLDE